MEYFTCVYHSILLFCPKKCQIKFNTLFDYRNQQQKGITNTAINHFPDIDYNKFMRIYRECTLKPCSFLIIDNTLPASDPLRFPKNFLSFFYDSN